MCLPLLTRRIREWPCAVAAEIPRIARGCGPHRGAGAARAGGCSISALEPADGWESWTPPNVRPRFTFRRRWCRASWPAAKRPWHALPRLPKTIRKPGGAIWLLGDSLRKDALVGIAASGRTPYVLGAVEAANKLGALTIGISCTPGFAAWRAGVQIAITPLVGPEVIAGSTRMKAGTATKLVLNMISTAVMIRLGYVYGNLMVNVQPRNSKLRDRATRIIAASAAVSYERAGELLAGGRRECARSDCDGPIVARSRLGRSAPGGGRRTYFGGVKN